MRTSLEHAALAALSLFLFVGCSSEAECVDMDRDGFGDGCTLGPDCDDQNQGRTTNCEGPPPDCEANPTLTGCPCLSGVTDCFPGAPAEANVGLCLAGQALCTSGFWGLCVGSIGPTFERCDGEDQDCDGVVDEGVISPCGGCTPDCTGGVWGEGTAPFDADDDPDLAVTNQGFLTLRAESIVSETVWVANSGEDTLSRVDAAEMRETGRYATGDEPSRVAVDFLGDGYVLSRAFGAIGSIQRVAGSDERCVDRDESGTLDTSNGSDLVDDDECVLATGSVGEIGDVPRALAIDGNLGLDASTGGEPWVGLHDGERILHLDPIDFSVLEAFDTPGFRPYAFAFDDQGTLWAISRDGLLLSLNRFDPAREIVIREIPLACFEVYGLAIDGNGRIAVTGFGCDSVTLYDPVQDRYSTIATASSVRGAVTEGDALFVAHTQGATSFLGTSPLQEERVISLGGPFETIGIGLTSEWVVAVSESGHPSGNGVVSFVGRESGAVEGETVVGFAPHTQGDLTGAKRQGAFVPDAQARHVFRGCGTEIATNWRTLRTFARLGGGEILVRARHAPTEAALSGPLVELGSAGEGESTFEVSFPTGGVVEVEVELRRGGADSAPRLQRVGFEWDCEGPI